MRLHAHRLIQLATAFLLLASFVQAPAQERVVAIADVHGDLDSFVAILQRTGLIDKSRHWIGGRATLVQTGDILDRGPKSRAVMDLLMALQKEARLSNGWVRAGLGNHEVMNIMGYLVDTVPEDYEAFADAGSEERRRRAFQEFASGQAKRRLSVDEAIWMREHPPGFIEHREAFGPRGVYGRWLRSLPAMTIAGDSAFLHGGISAELNTWSTDRINAAVSAEIQAFDKIKEYMVDNKLAFPFSTLTEMMATARTEVLTRKSKELEDLLQLPGWMAFREKGPLWFREFSSWPDAEGERNLSQIIKALKVKRIVVGHTVQPNGEIRSRFGGKAFLIDTGMLSTHFRGGRASALEISAGRIRAIYLNSQTELN